MLVNKTVLAQAFIAMSTIFNNAFADAPSQWQKIGMLVPSNTATNDYNWLSKIPQMKEWIDEKTVKSLAAYDYTIKNKDWEVTIAVDRNDIEDDQLGIYRPQAMMVGESAKQLPDEIVFALVNEAFTNKCYDGKAFFATDHKVGKTTVSNKGTKKLSIATLAAAQASYGAARIALMKMKSDEGRSLNIKPNILLVPPALADIANALMTVDRLEDGKPNIYKGTAEVVVDNKLTSDDAWFLLDTTKAIKPFIYQERKKPTFVQQTDMASDDVFNRKQFKFGAEARASGGYGFWQLAYGSDGTVA